MTDKANDFLAAAQRQKKIEQQVQAQGEDARKELERKAALANSPAAAERLREQEEKEQALQRIIDFANAEVSQIIDILEALPADSDDRRFVIKRETDLTMGGGVTIRCHYATADEASDGFHFSKEGKPAFRLWFSGSSIFPERLPTIYFYDHSRLVPDGTSYPDPTKTEAADGADLRAVIGAFIARNTPERLDEIAAALQPPREQPKPALSQDMTLRAPRVSARKPKG